MDRVLKSVLFSSVLVALFFTSYAQQNCDGFRFENNKKYQLCNVLPVQNSSVHWTYTRSNNTVDLAFRRAGTSSSQWVSWALNPSGRQMVGSQCLVAYQGSNGVIRAYTSPITNGNPQLRQGNLSFQVPSIRATLTGDEMTIYATLQLTSELLSTNQIWQFGPLNGGSPARHEMNTENMQSIGTIDFRTGQTTGSSGGDSNTTQTNSTQTNTNNCNGFSFENSKQYESCNVLPVQSSTLHWTYTQSNNTVDLAFRRTGTSSSQWVSWALNPSGRQMVGSQCLVAYQGSDGVIQAYTSPITNGNPQLQQGGLSFQVPSIRATLTGDEMTIYATLQLTSDLLSTNHVWQFGPLSGGSPARHEMNTENMQSVGIIDFRTGQTTGSGGGDVNSRQRKRNTHGVLNAVSWGILMPMGAMLARYLKVFKSANPAWFYLHVACQCSAYIVGVAGWATGIKLGNENPITISNIHRNVGITLFALGTLQVFALLLRPKPDHKYRFYWNIYHHATGYTVIGLSIYNVLKGLEILNAADDWWWAYVGTLIGLASLAAILEPVTWFIVIKRKKESREKLPHTTNGVNGANGHSGL